MARIRIIDEWLRSPVSGPSRYRAIMVVAERWAEQRVLMRAFQDCRDQTRPTIVLHGVELAIGPAGTTPSGPWGIHVQPPVDGRAQELRQQLELAAKRLVGARGSPARLEDEVSSFDDKKTNYWQPGAPRDRASQGGLQADYYEPAELAPPSPSAVVPSAAPRPAGQMTAAPPPRPTPRPTPNPMRMTPQPHRRRGWTSPVPHARAPELARGAGARTALGFAGAPVTRPRTVVRADSNPGKRLSKLVGRTMPVGFQLSDSERGVLNALGDAPSLTASQIGQLVGDSDPVAWMEALMAKLADNGLDLIVPGDDVAGEPTYMLRR